MEAEPVEREVEAEYTLESVVTCPCCRQQIETLEVVRLMRTRINFTSSLPRRGQVMVCPRCHGIVAGGLGGFI